MDQSTTCISRYRLFLFTMLILTSCRETKGRCLCSIKKSMIKNLRLTKKTTFFLKKDNVKIILIDNFQLNRLKSL
jgi:hypothetical protein